MERYGFSVWSLNFKSDYFAKIAQLWISLQLRNYIIYNYIWLPERDVRHSEIRENAFFVFKASLRIFEIWPSSGCPIALNKQGS